MKKVKPFPYIFSGIISAIIFAISFYLICPAINIKNPVLWVLVDIVIFIYVILVRILKGKKDIGWATVSIKNGSKGRVKKQSKFNFNLLPYIVPIGLAVVLIIAAIGSSTLFNAVKYSEILTVAPSDFTSDLSESLGSDSIALMDTASAQMLGDREIGTLSDVVSQFNVSSSYTQIDYQGKPIKVAPLEYAGYFKWLNNKKNGIKGYVSVDPVSMSASFKNSDGMIYVPSAYFSENAVRHIRFEYPTLMLTNLHFEIDESGKPYYIASIVDYTIGLFGGKTVTGCIVLDPVTGEMERYDLDSVPQWIDVVFSGNLICKQYNWHGMYANGLLNSLFSKKDCKQVTVYTSDSEDAYDETPTSDYGYISKDGDIWIYTGVTSLNGDSSNIGFLLSNERTGESKYYAVAGADEKSAMAAAEGEVQEKGYQASFPSLININGNPTYIMVLKDSGGLVKLYAAVNVEQYNLVTTATTQAECIRKYKTLLGISDLEAGDDDAKEVTVTVKKIRFVDIDGNTYIYLIDSKDNIYKAKAATHEELLLIDEGDTVALLVTGENIKGLSTN